MLVEFETSIQIVALEITQLETPFYQTEYSARIDSGLIAEINCDFNHGETVLVLRFSEPEIRNIYKAFESAIQTSTVRITVLSMAEEGIVAIDELKFWQIPE